jgi:hypothetical protein
MRARQGDTVDANITDKGTGATGLEIAFHNPVAEDYRLTPGNPLNRRGVDNQFTILVTHDFYGLLRFPEDGRAVGAFRHESVPKPGVHTMIEVEFQDGRRQRLYDVLP